MQIFFVTNTEHRNGYLSYKYNKIFFYNYHLDVHLSVTERYNCQSENVRIIQSISILKLLVILLIFTFLPTTVAYIADSVFVMLLCFYGVLRYLILTATHPDHNKGPDPSTLCMYWDPSSSYILTTLYSSQPTLWLNDLSGNPNCAW